MHDPASRSSSRRSTRRCRRSCARLEEAGADGRRALQPLLPARHRPRGARGRARAAPVRPERAAAAGSASSRSSSGDARLSLAATGGVHTSIDALKAIMAGANGVQIVSALLALRARRTSETVLDELSALARGARVRVAPAGDRQHEPRAVPRSVGVRARELRPDPPVLARLRGRAPLLGPGCVHGGLAADQRPRRPPCRLRGLENRLRASRRGASILGERRRAREERDERCAPAAVGRRPAESRGGEDVAKHPRRSEPGGRATGRTRGGGVRGPRGHETSRTGPKTRPRVGIAGRGGGETGCGNDDPEDGGADRKQTSPGSAEAPRGVRIRDFPSHQIAGRSTIGPVPSDPWSPVP